MDSASRTSLFNAADKAWDISDYFTEQVIVGAKDECEIQWNHRENRAVCWNK